MRKTKTFPGIPIFVFYVKSGVVTGRSSQRMAPAEAGESRVVAVGCNPLGVAFNCERREVSIRDERPFRSGRDAEPPEDFPMRCARSHPDARGMAAQGVHECQGVVKAGRLGKNAWMGKNSHYAG